MYYNEYSGLYVMSDVEIQDVSKMCRQVYHFDALVCTFVPQTVVK